VRTLLRVLPSIGDGGNGTFEIGYCRYS